MKKDIHGEAVRQFDSIQEAIRDERLQCLEDRRFYSIAGAQWEGPLGDQFDNKPRFEVNKIHLSVIRIINEYRANRITVNFVSKDGAESDELADMCDGLYRANEQDSVAEEAYDNAFEEAVAGGFGAWRLRAEYEDDEDAEEDKQCIRIEPIFDADSSVFFDLQAKRQDKSDAMHCFVLTSMTHDAYKDTYDDDPASWPKDIEQVEFDWATPDVVYVAEYYKVEYNSRTLQVWEHLDGEVERIWEDELEDEGIDQLKAVGAKLTKERTVKSKQIHKYILSGAKVLEDCGIIAGQNIPIIPCYGKRWFVDNVERCMGHVRLAKDAQRLKNMQLSKLGEISAMSTVEKPIFTYEQIAGHQVMWEEDNVKNWPYLLVNPIEDPTTGQQMPAGPIAYTKPPTIPPAMAALLQITEEDMSDLLGNQQQGEEIAGNVSTETAMIVQNRLDMQTHIYMTNMAKAIKRCGEVWLSMAKDVYVEEGRQVKLVGDQGEIDTARLVEPKIGKNGETVYENDLSRAKFDVAVEVGPSSSTKRASTVRSLTALMGVAADPETQQVLSSMIMLNMEGEGISDVRQFFRKKLLRMGVVDPTEQEKQELQAELENQQPSANDQYLQAAAANEQAKAVKAQADTILTQARADETRAKTAQIITETDVKEQEQALEVIDRLGPRVTPPNIPGSEVQE